MYSEGVFFLPLMHDWLHLSRSLTYLAPDWLSWTVTFLPAALGPIRFQISLS